MGAYPLGQPVPNRADVEVHGLQAPKGALHCRQTLIRADGPLGRESLPRHTRADHIDPIERRVRSEALRIASIPQLRVGDRDLEVLAHLKTIPYLRDPRGNRRLT